MNRRDVLKSVGLIVGGTIVGAEAFLVGCTSPKAGILTSKQVQLLEEIAETILPKTKNSPGAKDAKVGDFMNRIVTDFYTMVEQEVFLNSLKRYEEIKFATLSAAEKERHLLKQEEAIKENPITVFTAKDGTISETRAPYIMIKQLAIWAYLSSELVAQSAFKHMPIPAHYYGCVEVTSQVKPMYNVPSAGKALRKVKE